MQQVLKVEGMSCKHCVSSIEKGLKEQNVKAKVDLKKKTVVVQYDDSIVTLEKIKETIEDLGYDMKD